jgi:putative oxidoreductase
MGHPPPVWFPEPTTAKGIGSDTMNRSALEDAGKLVLRATVGGLLLLHGVAKVSHGVAGIARIAESKHVPGFVAYGVYIGEVVAPILVLAGIGTRPAALVIAFNMIVAVALAHSGQIFSLAPSGGLAIEPAAMYLLGAIAVALLGAGRYSITRGRGRWD